MVEIISFFRPSNYPNKFHFVVKFLIVLDSELNLSCRGLRKSQLAVFSKLNILRNASENFYKIQIVHVYKAVVIFFLSMI